MIRWTRAAVRAWLERLLHVHDSPRRTAAAFALGVFIGFSPFLGLHTLLALALAFLLGLNRVAVIIGVYSNLPWIMAQWYALMTALGAWLLGTRLPHGFAGRLRQLFALSLLDAEFWRRLADLLRPLLWPYVVGSTLGAAVLAGAAFLGVRGFIEARRRHLFHLPHHGGGAQHRP
ncbi:MAG: DUF2062 domain-containing protein [Chloroflexi bacterium]|nr:DUF2062 domain-containing protein [Chloroflexota bacterium]MBE3098833.1 DUF2062 domain-containing protein [Planctomycetota bacterium]